MDFDLDIEKRVTLPRLREQGETGNDVSNTQFDYVKSKTFLPPNKNRETRVPPLSKSLSEKLQSQSNIESSVIGSR